MRTMSVYMFNIFYILYVCTVNIYTYIGILAPFDGPSTQSVPISST